MRELPVLRRISAQKRQATTRAKRAEAAPVHPNEQIELRERAYENVKDDLSLIHRQSVRRAEIGNKRIKFIAQCEIEIISELLNTLDIVRRER